jgi:hypothetical protein
MKTTTTTKNIELANELLKTRELLKTLTKRDKELKAYFTDLINTDKNLTIGTAIVISRKECSRTAYDKTILDNYFQWNNLDNNEYKKTTWFNQLNVQEL